MMGKRKESYERIAWVKYKGGIIQSGIVRNKFPEKYDVIRLTIKGTSKKGRSEIDKIDEIFTVDEAISIVTVMQSAICKYVMPHAETLRKLEEKAE